MTVGRERAKLQDSAALLFGVRALCQESSASGCFKDLSDTIIGSGRAFEVPEGTDLLADLLTLRGSQRNSDTKLNYQGGGDESSDLNLDRRTCSGVTGFCEVLCNSSMVLLSKRKSFLQPTRMIGRPWQKWRTSEIH
jgi:hypothetical protein